MAGRNIIWCQTSDASDIADLTGKAYTNVIISALHMHNRIDESESRELGHLHRRGTAGKNDMCRV